MPRSSVVLGSVPVDADTIARAAGAVWVKADPDAGDLELVPVDGGAVLQVRAGGRAVLSVLRPRLLPTLDEIDRLLPGIDAPAGTAWWTDAYTPWSPEGAIGVAILDAAAEASGALVVHQGALYAPE